jgi:uncharacterized membrane protein
MYVRMMLWIPALAYFAFLLAIKDETPSASTVVTTVFLGALFGFVVAITFAGRQCRRARARD